LQSLVKKAQGILGVNGVSFFELLMNVLKQVMFELQNAKWSIQGSSAAHSLVAQRRIRTNNAKILVMPRLTTTASSALMLTENKL
jgi:hypothetical protein